MNKHNCMRFLLLLLMSSLGSPFVYAQQAVSMRYAKKAKEQTSPKTDKRSEKEQALNLSTISTEADCLDCSTTWDLKNKADVSALKHEIETHALDESYEWKAKLKFLYSSPHVMKTLIMDPTFPIIIMSGDKAADLKAYNQAKTEWVRKYPARYEALKHSYKSSK